MAPKRARVVASSDSDDADLVDEDGHPFAGAPKWEDLAQSQPRLTATILKEAKDGTFFALEDRNSVAHESWRKVIARIRSSDRVVILTDVHGLPIHEPGEGVVHGSQPLDNFIDEFSETGDWFYRNPMTRREPRKRDVQAPRPSATKKKSEEMQAIPLEQQEEEHGGEEDAKDEEDEQVMEESAAGAEDDNEEGQQVEEPANDNGGDDGNEPLQEDMVPSTAASAMENDILFDDVDIQSMLNEPVSYLSDHDSDSQGDQKNYESEEPDDTAADRTRWSTGVRVTTADGKHGGMIATVSTIGRVTVALDNGEWAEMEGELLVRAPPNGDGLVDGANAGARRVGGISYDGRSTQAAQPTGMLMGLSDEYVFGGQACVARTYHIKHIIAC